MSNNLVLLALLGTPNQDVIGIPLNLVFHGMVFANEYHVCLRTIESLKARCAIAGWLKLERLTLHTLTFLWYAGINHSRQIFQNSM